MINVDIFFIMTKRVLTDFRRKYLRFRISEKRREVKLQCIEYKGGKCVHCGYNKCPAAMAFHHLNPNEKDFGISENGISRSFEKAKIELDKCILLCSNCHLELHHKETEKLRETKRLEIESEKRHFSKSINKNCSCCQKEIKICNSTNAKYNYCNRACRTKHRNLLEDLEWISNNELIELAKNFSIKEIALKLNKTVGQINKRLFKIRKFLK